MILFVIINTNKINYLLLNIINISIEESKHRCPPLDYDRVYELKQEFPDLGIVLNGGIASTDEVLSHPDKADGVMIGRQAYYESYILTELGQALFPNEEWQAPSRHEIIKLMTP